MYACIQNVIMTSLHMQVALGGKNKCPLDAVLASSYYGKYSYKGLGVLWEGRGVGNTVQDVLCF
jgi:hypothetical protein